MIAAGHHADCLGLLQQAVDPTQNTLVYYLVIHTVIRHNFCYPIRSAKFAARARRMHFQKITGTLKINIIFKICKYLPFTSKNIRQKRKLEIKIFKFFSFSQNGPIGFCFFDLI